MGRGEREEEKKKDKGEEKLWKLRIRNMEGGKKGTKGVRCRTDLAEMVRMEKKKRISGWRESDDRNWGSSVV